MQGTLIPDFCTCAFENISWEVFNIFFSDLIDFVATHSLPFGSLSPARFVIEVFLFLLVLFFVFSSQGSHAKPFLPLFPSKDYFVLFSTHCHGYSLPFHPLLINYFYKSLYCACHSRQNSLQVFGVFVLMECKECTQFSRCALAHHTCSKKDRDLMPHKACWQHRVALAFFVASWRWDSCVITPGNTLQLIIWPSNDFPPDIWNLFLSPLGEFHLLAHIAIILGGVWSFPPLWCWRSTSLTAVLSEYITNRPPTRPSISLSLGGHWTRPFTAV